MERSTLTFTKKLLIGDFYGKWTLIRKKIKSR
jgi:hypothetical protein